MANIKAADLSSTPTQEEGAVGGLSSQCSSGRNLEKSVDYLDASRGGGVAGGARKFSLCVI